MASKTGTHWRKGPSVLHSKCMIDCALYFDLCIHCIYGKHNWVRFPCTATRAQGILDLIHSYVFGSVHASSLGKYVYYVSFIDDYSRHTWVYFIRNKS